MLEGKPEAEKQRIL